MGGEKDSLPKTDLGAFRLNVVFVPFSPSTVGYWARNALLRRLGRHQCRPRRRRRTLLPQHVDGLGCVGHHPACHLLGMVSSVLASPSMRLLLKQGGNTT